MNIDWMAFVVVFLTSLLAAAAVVALFSFGIRFLATPAPPVRREDGTFEPNGPSRDDENDDIEETGRPGWATAAAYFCFGLSGLVVLFGIYLIVNSSHG